MEWNGMGRNGMAGGMEHTYNVIMDWKRARHPITKYTLPFLQSSLWAGNFFFFQAAVTDTLSKKKKKMSGKLGKWKTRKAGTGTGTETETEIWKRSSDLKVSIVRVDGNSMQVCW